MAAADSYNFRCDQISRKEQRAKMNLQVFLSLITFFYFHLIFFSKAFFLETINRRFLGHKNIRKDIVSYLIPFCYYEKARGTRQNRSLIFLNELTTNGFCYPVC